jgi:lipopolysaccharide transport system ATP-binding protein
MFVRLGFAIAVSLDPEILIVDEVIAVGDEEFQRKCFDHLFELRKRGTTIVLVTHALGLIQDLCDRAAWLDHGLVREIGPAREVVDSYLRDVNEREIRARGETAVGVPVQPGTGRLGTGEIRVESVEFLDARGRHSPVLMAGSACTIRLHYRAQASIDQAVFGIGFLHESGANVAGPNSGRTGPRPVPKGRGYVDFVVDELLLQPATYQVSTAIVDRGRTYDYADREFDLHVRATGEQEPGLTRMPGAWVGPFPDESPTTGRPAA